MIELRDVTRRYPGVTALERVSFRLSKGESAAVLGESGSGKSTLLRVIAGLEQPDEGEILIRDRVCRAGDELCGRGVAMVFQEPALWNHMTVEKNIMYGMSGRDRGAKKKLTAELMRELGISGLERRYPEEISGGQAKRVALARALAADKEILLLDEPLTNLDAESRELALKCLEERCVGRKTIICVTHSMEEAERLCGRVYEMKAGVLTFRKTVGREGERPDEKGGA